jgi:hypothetical protein
MEVQKNEQQKDNSFVIKHLKYHFSHYKRSLMFTLRSIGPLSEG